MTVLAEIARPTLNVTQRRRRPVLGLLSDAARTPRGAMGLLLMLAVVAVAAIGPTLAPHDPAAFVVSPFAHPSHTAPLGGDMLGRDVLSRVLAGGWVLLAASAAATAVGIVLGALAGIAAAYLRGRIDGAIMRTVDVVLAFPQIVFALLFVSILGPRQWLIVLVIGLSHAPQVARVLRSAALDVSERDFVKAVELMGIKRSRIMMREILPNLISPLMVEIGLRLTYSIIAISGLALLGFGQPPPAPNWGIMIGENRVGLQANPWAVVVPSLLIALLTIGTNTFTDAVTRVGLGLSRRRQRSEAEADLTPGETS